jgi:hypothetical protein
LEVEESEESDGELVVWFWSTQPNTHLVSPLICRW